MTQLKKIQKQQMEVLNREVSSEDIEILKPYYNQTTKEYSILNGEVFHQKASMVPATKAAYNMVDRAFLFLGEMTLPKNTNPCMLTGCYFTRNNSCKINHQYMLLSIIPEPTNPSGFSRIYACECNELVEIQISEQSDVFDPETGKYPIVWKTISTASGYYNAVIRSLKTTQDGNFDQTIYTLILPARYKLSVDMRILKQTFFKGNVVKMAYRVESIDTALTDIEGNVSQSGIAMDGEIYGVVNCQLTQQGVIIDENNGS